MTGYYDRVLEIVLAHLKSMQDPSLDLMGSIRLLTKICELEPNVDKAIVTRLYDTLRHRLETQFQESYLDLV